MRKIIILLLFIVSQTVNAQLTDGQLRLKTGLSVPLFEYSSNSLEDGCFTLPGLTTSIGFSTKVYHNLGAEIQTGFQLHPVDVSALGYYKVQADPFLLDVTIRSEPYRVIHFIGGPNYTFTPTNKWYCNVKVLAGLFYSSTPYQLYKPTYFLTGPSAYEITSSSDYSFAVGTGFNCYYNLTDCYSVGIESELLRSKAGFIFYTATGMRTDWRQITMLNISLSLALKIPYGQ